MINKARGLFDKDGILTSPPQKKGKALNSETKTLVKMFYLNDDVSRLMPGKKDFISIKENGVRRHEQKRLLLCNLRELYTLFENKTQTIPSGFRLSQSYDQRIAFWQVLMVRTRSVFAPYTKIRF